ncbi:AbrB family transcriptional regulator [Halobacteriales archaeon SW_6_65_15]|nr:MAG: AbrB family transcriptional regulator [Halobacteriales archaeon SW_6_65_15]
MSSDQTTQTRKLQKVGGSTYTVSIPKRWACEQGLETGDDIHLYAHDDGSLVVRSSRHDGGSLASVQVEVAEATTDGVTEALKATYASGFEEIELVADETFDADQRRAANSLARTLVGTEVVAADRDRITVRNLLDPANVSVQQSLIQLQFVTCSMHRAATAAVTGQGSPSQVRDRAEEVDRLCVLITRHFVRSLSDFSEVDQLGVSRARLFEYYATARQLGRVADDVAAVLDLAEDRDWTVTDEVAVEFDRVAAAARQVVEDATDAVVSGPGTASTDALDLYDEVVADVEAIERTLFERDAPEAYHLTRALDRVVRTAECGAAIAGIAVRSSLRSPE